MSSTAMDLLRPRAVVTEDELTRMPPTLTPAEALLWTRLSRAAFYRAINAGEIEAFRLGRAWQIPTRRFMVRLGVLVETAVRAPLLHEPYAVAAGAE